MNKWLPLALVLTTASAVAVEPSLPFLHSKVEPQPLTDTTQPRQARHFSTTRELSSFFEQHLKQTVDSQLKVASNGYRYLDIHVSTLEDAENYYAQIDPYVHPYLDGIELEFIDSTTIQVRGFATTGDAANAFPRSMQLRFFYLDANNVEQSQIRSIRATGTYDGVNVFTYFDTPFNQDIIDGFTRYERVGSKYNLTQWRSQNNVYESNSTVAAYSNDADLGFGRRMVANQQGDEVFFYVGNYDNASDAQQQRNLQATVAMEYSRVGSNSYKETQFYVFDSQGARLLKIDLDLEGDKFVPGLCQNCHDNGFIVFDAESFGYSSTLPRAMQESQFKQLNDLVLATNPTALATEIIAKWYQSSDIQDSSAVPDDWNNDPEIYNKVLKPYCRSCHLSVASSGPMKYANFMASPSYYINRFCDTSYTMPHAKVTHTNLMSDATALAALTTRFGQPIPCWIGTPVIDDVQHDSPIDLTENASVRIDRELAIATTADHFDVKIVRHADSRCINPDTGAVIGTSSNDDCWTAQTFTFNPLNGTYNYSDDWVVNPALDLVNWNAGTYTYQVRAWGEDEQLSASQSTTFELQRPAPSVSDFSVSVNTYNKQENSNISYSYSLTSDQPIDTFERSIKRMSDGQWIDVNTGNTTSYAGRRSNWSVLSTASSSAPYQYSYTGAINPYISYSNWQEGTYALYTRAQNAAGDWSNETVLYFYIIDQPMPPTINYWSINPYSWDTSYNGNVNFSYTLQADQQLTSMERKIVRASDWRCINPATGQSGSCWHDYSALNYTGGTSPYTYGISGSLNPSTAYANWNTGTYYIYVRGYNATGQLSNQKYLIFKLN